MGGNVEKQTRDKNRTFYFGSALKGLPLCVHLSCTVSFPLIPFSLHFLSVEVYGFFFPSKVLVNPLTLSPLPVALKLGVNQNTAL